MPGQLDLFLQLNVDKYWFDPICIPSSSQNSLTQMSITTVLDGTENYAS